MPPTSPSASAGKSARRSPRERPLVVAAPDVDHRRRVRMRRRPRRGVAGGHLQLREPRRTDDRSAARVRRRTRAGDLDSSSSAASCLRYCLRARPRACSNDLLSVARKRWWADRRQLAACGVATAEKREFLWSTCCVNDRAACVAARRSGGCWPTSASNFVVGEGLRRVGRRAASRDLRVFALHLAFEPPGPLPGIGRRRDPPPTAYADSSSASRYASVEVRLAPAPGRISTVLAGRGARRRCCCEDVCNWCPPLERLALVPGNEREQLPVVETVEVEVVHPPSCR